jgi:hypothetical protein
MSKFPHLFTQAFIIFAITFFIGCGYKPSSKYARSVVGEKVSTSIIISAQDPENTVVIKDAVDSAIIEIFQASLVSRNYSDTHLEFSITSPSYEAIQYDSNGFIIAYRATIVLNVLRISKDTQKRYTSKGTYDFTVSANAVITDQERFDAIKFSATKAITSFVAQVSAEGSRNKTE